MIALPERFPGIISKYYLIYFQSTLCRDRNIPGKQINYMFTGELLYKYLLYISVQKW